MYAPGLDQLIEGFWGFEAPAGMGVQGIARRLDKMQEDIGEICGGGRAGRVARKVALLLALKRVWGGSGRERLAEWEWRVY
jgi:hypothetical protein